MRWKESWNRAVLDMLLPTREQLRKLAHVRRSTVEPGKAASWQECAVVLANRPVKPGSRSTVHLVSVEGRYGDDGRFAVANGQQSVRLASSRAGSSPAAIGVIRTFAALSRR